MTGLSRAQLTRLIGQHRETGRIEDRRGGAPACPFERRYTRALMRRQYEVFGGIDPTWWTPDPLGGGIHSAEIAPSGEGDVSASR